MRFFEQQKFLNKIKIEFKDNGILYSYGNFLSLKSFFIEYENIVYQQFTKETKTDKFNFFVCVLSGITVLRSIIGIFDNPEGIYKGLLPLSSIFFIIFLIVTILGRTKYVYIDTYYGQRLKLFDNNPDKTKFNIFLQNLDENIKNYFRAKYIETDSDIVSKEVQIENLLWLKKNKIISAQEYDNLKNELLGSKVTKIKGFTKESLD